MADIEKITDKIRKLLAKAASTTSEEEAAAFSAKAHDMMIQHQLSMTDVEDKQVFVEEGAGVFAFSVTYDTPWRRLLADSVGRYFLCRWIRYPNAKRYAYVGRKSRAEVAQMMFDHLQKTVYRLAAEHSKVNGKWTRLGFERGCGFGLSRRLDKMTAAAKGHLSDPRIPQLYDQAAAEVKDFMDGVKPKKIQMNGGLGFADGQVAANGVSLSTQVGGTKKTSHTQIGN